MSKYTQMDRAALVVEANARKLLPTGATGEGGGAWRATARKSALIAALEACDAGKTIDPHEVEAGDTDPILALAKGLMPAIRQAIVNTDEFPTMLAEAIRKARLVETPLVIQPRVDAPPITLETYHPTLETLISLCTARVNVCMVGPAGSGKSTAAEQVAKTLDLPFYAVSLGPQTTQSAIFGYTDATGRYVSTITRQAFENGGVLLWDELDRANPGVFTANNQMLANDVCAFPDGMIERHKDCIFIAAANTYGMGANRQYVGAMQLDAASVDRFVMLDWPYDEAFELKLAVQAGGEQAADWVKYVQKLRKSADAKGIRHIISPRASISGAKLLALGLNRKLVEDLVIWKGLDSEARLKISAE